MTPMCKNHGDPDAIDCVGFADDRYTMDFSDIGLPPIFWCSVCGPEAHELEASIMIAFETRPGFAEEFERAIEKAENER